MELLIIAGISVFVVFTFLIWVASRYRRCPSDKILVVYGKVGGGKSAKCLHGGATFVIPVIQDYQYLDLTPIPLEIKLEGALSKQNIRVNTPSSFMVGISTEPGVMENAAERLLGLAMDEIKDLARDIIFGQMRVVIATMNIEEINADRDKLIANISMGVEVELKKVGLRLINVNIQDITDSSGYIDALGREAASKAINEAKIKVALADRDGQIGSSEAHRDQRVRVSNANAEATKGENLAGVEVANSNASLREQKADAERRASAAEKVAQAKALEAAYAQEQQAERQRAERDKATQYANVVVPAEIAKSRLVVESDAEAERIRRTQQGAADGVRMHKQAEADGIKLVQFAEADGLKARFTAEAEGIRLKLLAEAEGTEALLKKKAEGFRNLIETCGGPEAARHLLITEQMPALVREQAEAISNLKIDKVTVWDTGKNANGKNSTAEFVSGLVGALPPLHELTRNVGIKMPSFAGEAVGEGGGETKASPPAGRPKGDAR
jgi:flotillin